MKKLAQKPSPVKSLLTQQADNPKLAKSSEYITVGLSLSPANTSGRQVCAHSTPGCRRSCIFFSGNATVYPRVNQVRLARTRLWFEHPAVFKWMIIRDLEEVVGSAVEQGKPVACRPNIYSDIPWEEEFPELFTTFPAVQFYDYTKDPARMLAFLRKEFPPNYHLTFSRSEKNEDDCLDVLSRGGNVSVVFKIKPKAWVKERPSHWRGFPMFDGEVNDLRFLDPAGVVGLRAKGRGLRDKTGFVLEV